MKYVIGIDPGKSGAGVLIDEEGSFIDMFRGDSTLQDQYKSMEGWSNFNATLLIIENVHSMPKQGVASSFKFGMSFGFLLGIVTASRIRYEKVTPQKWQGILGCRSGGDKNVTKAKAQEMFPKIGLVITHRIADALLIAEYARRLAIERGYILLGKKTRRMK
jgi:hypothetical protein